MFKLVDILKFARINSATDIFLKSGSVPWIKQKGKLHEVDMQPLTTEIISEFIYMLLISPQQKKFKESPEQVELVFGCERPDLGRFRIAIYKQLSGVSVAIRLVSTTERLEAMSIYSNLNKYTSEPGLIIVAGDAGSGRSTLASALIHTINQHVAKHIITLEDPIETRHNNVRSIVDQREGQIDYNDIYAALKLVRTSSTDVLYIDHLHDYHITQQALHYAASGLLVIVPFHSNTPEEIIYRLIDTFPAPDRKAMRFFLADVLKTILIQKTTYQDNKAIYSYYAFENNENFRNQIRDGNLQTLYMNYFSIENDFKSVIN